MHLTKNTSVAATFCLSLGLALSCPATAPSSVNVTRLQEEADTIVLRGAVGVIATVQAPSGPYTVKSGFGNLTAQTPVPDNTHFRIGSLSKPFLAVVILQLVQEGRMSLNDTLEKWIPGTIDGTKYDEKNISVRQLLQHTSGIADFVSVLPLESYDNFEKHRYDTWTRQELIAAAMSQDPLFAPGADWHYSNTGFVLAGLIVEKVTSNSWSDEIRNRIIRPLGLKNTIVAGDTPEMPSPHAVGYWAFPIGNGTEYGDFIDATRMNPTHANSAGEIISTGADANVFLHSLIGGRLLRAAQIKEMQTTVPAKMIQSSLPGAEYGLGIFWVPSSCGGMWSHPGEIQGFRTRNGISKDGRSSIVISINSGPVLKPKPNAPEQTSRDVALDIIEAFLCEK